MCREASPRSLAQRSPVYCGTTALCCASGARITGPQPAVMDGVNTCRFCSDQPCLQCLLAHLGLRSHAIASLILLQYLK